jgi:quercetin dioxygenase-like cupin family protein
VPKTDLLPSLKGRDDCVSYEVANGNTIWVRASAADTGGAYTLIEGRHIAGTGPPLHTHDAEDETFWVVDGSYAIWAGDDEFSAAEGDLVFVPRLVPHRFQCVNDGRMLLLYTPGGFERFLVERASAESARGGSLPPEELDAIGRKYGMRIV